MQEFNLFTSECMNKFLLLKSGGGGCFCRLTLHRVTATILIFCSRTIRNLHLLINYIYMSLTKALNDSILFQNNVGMCANDILSLYVVAFKYYSVYVSVSTRKSPGLGMLDRKCPILLDVIESHWSMQPGHFVRI